MVKSTSVAFFAGLVAAAQAYTVAVGGNPSGNPIITPKTSGSVSAGKTFDITWTPTSGGTVTIYLCKGPATNCVNQETPLADKVANSGSFTWQVPTTLEASATETQGYGIQLISDQTPSIFQWSGQFGIINKSPTSSSASASVSAASVSLSSSSVSSTASASHSSSAPSVAPTTVKSSSASSTASAVVGTVTGGATGGANVTTLQPTIPMSVPSSLKTSATAAASGSATHSGTAAVSTGAAAAVKVGAGALFGGVLAALAI